MATRETLALAAAPVRADIDRAMARTWLGQMLLIRRFEEKAAELYSAGKIRGFLHLSIGEEAVSVAAIGALTEMDNVVSTYREHGHALVRGIPPGAVMAELFGKTNGASRGRGGSMHIFDVGRRFYGGNAIVGGGLPLAVGLALADRLLAREAITMCLFGDGAVAEGEFHESLNLASLWHLPVLFLCENNYYAMGTALERHQAETDISRKGDAYRIPSVAVDGMDLLATRAVVRQAVDEVRSGDGPVLLECRTYRFRAHSMYDPELYRSKEEVEQWKLRDPITLFRAYLEPAGILTRAEIEALDAEARDATDRAVAFAEAGEWEPIADLLKDVYTGEGTMRLTYREALRTALREALLADSRVFLMGEDVGRYGGAYAVSKGLLEEFGPDRIRDTPLSESAFVGAGIGSALGGMRPIVEVMTVNFSLLALDQVVNTAATLRHMSGGQLGVPLVVRMATGAGRQVAAQHSHSLEGWYAHIPGISVVAPATPHDARWMLPAALKEPDPVFIFEHAMLYTEEGEVGAEPGPLSLFQAAVRRAGRDVTLIAHGGSVGKALTAAEQLAREGVEADVIDLRSLRPLDDATILDSVRRCHRVVVIDEAWRSGSLAAEISSRISEAAFFDLDAPVARVCSAEVPIPYPKHLEDAALPQVDRICQAVRAILKPASGVLPAPAVAG